MITDVTTVPTAMLVQLMLDTSSGAMQMRVDSNLSIQVVAKTWSPTVTTLNNLPVVDLGDPIETMLASVTMLNLQDDIVLSQQRIAIIDAFIAEAQAVGSSLDTATTASSIVNSILN